jgi:hypothetical protein
MGILLLHPFDYSDRLSVAKAFAALDPQPREALQGGIHALIDKFNAAQDGTLVVPAKISRRSSPSEAESGRSGRGGQAPAQPWNIAMLLVAIVDRAERGERQRISLKPVC